VETYAHEHADDRKTITEAIKQAEAETQGAEEKSEVVSAQHHD
jgi:hypothetical protein